MTCGQRGVAKSHFFQFYLHDTIEDCVALLLCRPFARAALHTQREQRCDQKSARVRHRVNLTRIGGDNARTASPRAFRAGLKRVRNAQIIAAEPNPLPGSESTLARSTLPSARTQARTITDCSYRSWASAASGQGHCHCSLGRLTGCSAALLTAAVAAGLGVCSALRLTGFVLVPLLVVAPPA
jgi:hypothetical protein